MGLNLEARDFIIKQKDNIENDKWYDFFIDLCDEMASDAKINDVLKFIVADCKIPLLPFVDTDNEQHNWNGLFKGCEFLTEVELPRNIVDIPEYMFEGCTKLKTVKLNDNLQSIGVDAFHNCTSLTELFIPASCLLIQENAFNNSGIRKLTMKQELFSLDFKTKTGLSQYCDIVLY